MDARRVVLWPLAVTMLCSCSTAAQQGFTPLAGSLDGGPMPRPNVRDPSPAGKSLKQHDLLYVSNANGTVNVYRYWQRTLAQVLTKFTQPAGQCVDRSNDVFIADKSTGDIDEYGHGGAKPIHVIDESGYEPDSCADAISNGNLAVANFNKGYYTTGTIAVYPHGSGQPVLYQGLTDDHFENCAYDDRGDLLAVSQNYYYYYFYSYYDFYYLPKHGTKLISMTIPGPSPSGWGEVDDIGWDGTYWVVASGGTLYRYTINIKAKLVDTIQLSGGYGEFGRLSFYRTTPTAKASEVVETTLSFSANKSSVEFWNYPAGGNAIGEITKDLDSPVGVAISRRTQ